MRKISFKKLQTMIDDGMAEVNAWELNGNCCDVTLHNSNADKPSKREVVEITNIPKDAEVLK